MRSISGGGRQFLAFVIASLGWAGAARLLLDADIVHPVAVGVVWLIGFVWITGYIASGPRDADHLVRTWLLMLAGIAAIAGVIVLAVS
ncbi:MAG: hypothetical protein AB7O39_03125 [Flavobacteriaceae bacterium]